MKVRLVVEGEKDGAALDVIAARLGAEVVAPAFVAQGRPEKVAELVEHVHAAFFSVWPRPERIVVVDDVDVDDPATHLALLTRLARRARVPVQPVVIARELESWFLADWETLNVRRQSRHPEETASPKEKLRRLLGGRWNRVIARALANEIDLARVARRCNRWRGLHKFAVALGCSIP